jgi:hypothetical protein
MRQEPPKATTDLEATRSEAFHHAGAAGAEGEGACRNVAPRHTRHVTQLPLGGFDVVDVRVCGSHECASTACVLNRSRPACRSRLAADSRQRTTAEIALEMNATSDHIARSVPAPAHAIAFLNDLRRTNDDLREKLGRERLHEADGSRTPHLKVAAPEHRRPGIPPDPGTPRS